MRRRKALFTPSSPSLPRPSIQSRLGGGDPATAPAKGKKYLRKCRQKRERRTQKKSPSLAPINRSIFIRLMPLPPSLSPFSRPCVKRENSFPSHARRRLGKRAKRGGREAEICVLAGTRTSSPTSPCACGIDGGVVFCVYE